MGLRWQCICIDSTDPGPIGHWWAELLGWRITHEEPDEVVLEPPVGSPEDGRLARHPVPAGAGAEGREGAPAHRPATDDQASEVARAEAMGATRVDIGQGDDVTWVVLADPDGNEFCILRALTAEELAG